VRTRELQLTLTQILPARTIALSTPSKQNAFDAGLLRARIPRASAAFSVKNLTRLLIVAAIVAALAVVWQIAWANIAHNLLQSDLREATAQIGGRIGLDAPSTEDDFKNLVIKRAADHGIVLTPDQIIVERIQSNDDSTWGLKVSTAYDVAIGFFGLTYPMHFTASASHA
jgi:hypothetical protein